MSSGSVGGIEVLVADRDQDHAKLERGVVSNPNSALGVVTSPASIAETSTLASLSSSSIQKLVPGRASAASKLK